MQRMEEMNEIEIQRERNRNVHEQELHNNEMANKEAIKRREEELHQVELERIQNTPKQTANVANGNVNILTSKLPKLELPKFNGDVKYWKEFWDIFSPEIDQRENITKAQKYRYLLHALGPKAKEKISGLAIPDENYKHAVQLLKDEYGKESLIIDSHRDALKRIKPAKNMAQLPAVFNEFEKHARSMEALKVDQHEFFLLRILKEIIPPNCLVNISRLREDTEWTLDELRAAIRKEISISKSAYPEREESPDRQRQGGFKNWKDKPYENRERGNGIPSRQSLKVNGAFTAQYGRNSKHNSHESNEEWEDDQHASHIKSQSAFVAQYGRNVKKKWTPTERTRPCAFCGGEHWPSDCHLQDESRTSPEKWRRLYNLFESRAYSKLL